MPKFLAYGRHSTKKQGVTRDVQEKQLHAYWQAVLEPEGVEWGGFFYDKATSGGTPLTERPEGRSLWALAQPGDHVGWSKLDRAFRSVRDGAHQMHLFKQRGVHTHSIDLRIDTSTPMGQFVLHVLIAFAELEHQYASIRTKEVVAQLRAAGHPKFHDCIGWRAVRDGHGGWVTTPDQQERDVVKHIYEQYRLGYSQEEISADLMRRGIRRVHTLWYPKTIRRAMAAYEAGFPQKPTPDGAFRSRSRTFRRSRKVSG